MNLYNQSDHNLRKRSNFPQTISLKRLHWRIEHSVPRVEALIAPPEDTNSVQDPTNTKWLLTLVTRDSEERNGFVGDVTRPCHKDGIQVMGECADLSYSMLTEQSRIRALYTAPWISCFVKQCNILIYSTTGSYYISRPCNESAVTFWEETYFLKFHSKCGQLRGRFEINFPLKFFSDLINLKMLTKFNFKPLRTVLVSATLICLIINLLIHDKGISGQFYIFVQI